MLSEKEAEYQEKLPTKDERKAMEAQKQKDMADAKIIKDLCREFLNEKLIPLDIPVFLVEEIVPQVMGSLIKIHKAKSKKYAEYLKVKGVMEEESMKDIEYVESIQA